RRPQTDPLPPHNVEAPHGLRRGGEGGDRRYHNQWGNTALARAVSLNNVATDRWAGFRASLKTGAMVFLRTVRNGFHPGYSKYAWTLALLLLIPLEDTRPMSAEVHYNHAWQLFLHGELAKSQQEAERGYNRFLASGPVWASKFQILEAEAMEWRGLYQDA